MTENKQPIRPNRIGFDSDATFKARLIKQAKSRGFDTYKPYIIHLIEKDRDLLAEIEKK